MENEELWRESAYRNLSDEGKAKVLELIHAYICGLKFSSNSEIAGDIITVFMGIIESFKK